MLKLGLVINPCAGVGGPVGLKGSDGADVLADALRRGATPRAAARSREALALLAASRQPVRLLTWGADMGAEAATAAGLEAEILGSPQDVTSAADTRAAVTALVAAGIDLLLFAGGDGTARDVLEVVGDQVPVLGIPAGVKMHSAVYAVNPRAAGRLLVRLAGDGFLDLVEAQVRDIDEAAFRRGEVRARHYGDLLVPDDRDCLQSVKCGGQAGEEEVLAGLGEWVAAGMADDCTYVIGPGTTTAAVMAALQLPNTLLGVDVVRDGAVLVADAGEQEILDCIAGREARIVVTAIGGQGHVFGRGNQQISPRVIRAVGRAGIIVVASRDKLRGLDGRCLHVDTGDAELDAHLSGHLPVVTGYDDRVLYPVSG